MSPAYILLGYEIEGYKSDVLFTVLFTVLKEGDK